MSRTIGTLSREQAYIHMLAVSSEGSVGVWSGQAGLCFVWLTAKQYFKACDAAHSSVFVSIVELKCLIDFLHRFSSPLPLPAYALATSLPLGVQAAGGSWASFRIAANSLLASPPH